MKRHYIWFHCFWVNLVYCYLPNDWFFCLCFIDFVFCFVFFCCSHSNYEDVILIELTEVILKVFVIRFRIQVWDIKIQGWQPLNSFFFIVFISLSFLLPNQRMFLLAYLSEAYVKFFTVYVSLWMNFVEVYVECCDSRIVPTFILLCRLRASIFTCIAEETTLLNWLNVSKWLIVTSELWQKVASINTRQTLTGLFSLALSVPSFFRLSQARYCSLL